MRERERLLQKSCPFSILIIYDDPNMKHMLQNDPRVEMKHGNDGDMYVCACVCLYVLKA